MNIMISPLIAFGKEGGLIRPDFRAPFCLRQPWLFLFV